MDLDDDDEYAPIKKVVKTISIVIGVIVFLIVAYNLVVAPLIKPWIASQNGKAELAQAEQNRQIAVLEATAKRESAVQLAQAEVERAKGVAEANQIIAKSITEPYLRYLWITEVSSAGTDKTIVYVPTEANVPILEASRST